MESKHKHALYMRRPDGGPIELVHADDVESRKAEGWSEPEGRKANGEKWNMEDDLLGQDVAANQAKADAEYRAKKESAKQKKAEATEKVVNKEAHGAEKSKK